MRPVLTIAGYAMIEARRSGLGGLAVGGIAAALSAAAFAGQLAITETRELQAATAGALLRICAVLLIASHVVASTARETSDRGLEFSLTLPLSRAQYYCGKLAGFAACAALLATFFALPMLLWAQPVPVIAWWISLACETALAAAIALFFSTTLVHIVPALGATAALYLLGRSISSMQAIAAGPFSGHHEHALGGAVDVLAVLVPRLERATKTEWLLYAAPDAQEWAIALGGLAIYFALAAAAGLLDFRRRNL